MCSPLPTLLPHLALHILLPFLSLLTIVIHFFSILDNSTQFKAALKELTALLNIAMHDDPAVLLNVLPQPSSAPDFNNIDNNNNNNNNNTNNNSMLTEYTDHSENSKKQIFQGCAGNGDG